MTTLEQATEVLELPAMPAPSFAPVFLVLTYYVGPGRGTKNWKLHHNHFTSEDAAVIYANKLQRWHLHRRIVRVG